MLELNDESSKEWFMENFKLNKTTQQIVLEAMIAKIEVENGVETLPNDLIAALTTDKLIELMEADGKDVDILNSKYKINLDLNYYFYLL